MRPAAHDRSCSNRPIVTIWFFAAQALLPVQSFVQLLTQGTAKSGCATTKLADYQSLTKLRKGTTGAGLQAVTFSLWEPSASALQTSSARRWFELAPPALAR